MGDGVAAVIGAQADTPELTFVDFFVILSAVDSFESLSEVVDLSQKAVVKNRIDDAAAFGNPDATLPSEITPR